MSRDKGLAVGAFDRWLVHDLRQALATGILLADPRADGENATAIAQRMGTVRQLLESMMAMLTADAVPPQSEPGLVDIGAVVLECVEAVSLAQEVPVAIVALAEAQGYGDGVLLRRAVRNVLDNASRAAGDDGKVTVSLTTHGSRAVIEVTDDGDGFGNGPSGTGQGLSMISHAMRAWRGTLKVSSGPDPGTTVRLVLPCETAGARP